jgi:D-alanyl-D-alanine carboxypeptidase (penicillin-binding protein 5/6)
MTGVAMIGPVQPARVCSFPDDAAAPTLSAVFYMGILRTFYFFIIVLGTMLAAKPVCIGQAAAFVIADQSTGYILESENAQKKLQVGSLTKIATAMVVLDWAEAKGVELGTQATVPNAPQVAGTAAGVGFRAGDRCSLRDLLYAALMQSDNLAAETLAYHVGSSLDNQSDASPVTAFVAQMNALARRLGMRRTLFLNPHGLDSLERKVPYSTAEDIARLTAYAMANSAFRFHVSQTERKISILSASGEPSSYLLRNTNELLGKESIDGVKTGTTRKAGGCVVISAARPPESRQEGDKVYITPRRLNVVVLGSNDRFNVAARLLTRGWQLYDAWASQGRPLKAGSAGR